MTNPWLTQPEMDPYPEETEMSYTSDCPGCFAGHHERHDPNHGVRPGLIGGTQCRCSGDCASRTDARWTMPLPGKPPVPAVAPNGPPGVPEAGSGTPEAHRAAEGVAARLRALALAEVTAARHGTRVQKTAARAAARAYRLAAEMVEEES